MTDRQLAGLPAASERGSILFLSRARGLEQIGRGCRYAAGSRAPTCIRFSSDEAYPPRPLYEVFDPKFWHANYGDGAFFKDKVIVVGVSAQVMHDVVDTPLGPSRPGPKLHLEAMAAAHGAPVPAHDAIAR